ncbi:unnamed protein product [Cuscuta europaea]|uniref:RNase H type-1 domain-containing protein n=1 Tax=Cuscuta europaea TaxID=41803 RepID=A0A9P0VMC2_CUSEU|nr:unnamed protein product [Cuscuta europaea]
MEFKFKVTNNEAEYEALIAGLRYARALGAARLNVRMDSQLVVTQMNGTAETREERMKAYRELSEEQTAQFEQVIIDLVPRVENAEADILSKLGNPLSGEQTSSVPQHIRNLARQEALLRPATEMIQVNAVSYADPNWVKEVADYLRNGKLPLEKDGRTSGRAPWIKRRAASFEIIGGELYKKTFVGPYLRCLSPDLAASVMEESMRASVPATRDPKRWQGRSSYRGTTGQPSSGTASTTPRGVWYASSTHPFREDRPASTPR